VIRSVLPSAVASAEAYYDGADNDLHPQEALLIAGAVDKRRREFAAVRRCARQALAELGYPAGPILRGPNNEPLWPDGVVGSMTHCEGYRAAAVAQARDLAGLGIDAEPHEELPDGVLEAIARPEEIPDLSELRSRFPAIHWDTLAFSAKESVYKAWFPLARRWLGFHDATLRFDPLERSFIAELHQAGPMVGRTPLIRMAGRYIVDNGLIVTTVPVGN
jgi:4'-phosphopantetheinyl transferase EntD